MSRALRSASSGLIVSLFFSGLVSAQPAPARPAPGGPPLGRPVPPPPAAGRSADPFGVARAQAFGTQVLKPRPLEDAQLDEKDQKKYDSTITSMEKRAANLRASQSGNRTAELANAFKLGSTQLKYGQEKTARDSFEKAWQLVPELFGEPKSSTVVMGQIRSHLREIQLAAGKDPELALTLMSELNDAHTKAFEAIQQPKARDQLAQPLAQTWFHLMLTGQLDPESLEKGAAWVIRFPHIAVADRPLPPEQNAEYQSQLAQANINLPQKLRQLAERQVLPPGAARPRLNPDDAPDTVDPATAQAIMSLETKSGPIAQFMQAEVAFRFGQFRDGMTHTLNAWRELLEHYRGNAATVSPADAQIHFDSLAYIAGLNPIQALVVLDQTDSMYRNMLRVDRFFGAQVADFWAKMASTLPLSPPMLAKAAFWLEHVSKQHPDAASRYSNSLAEVKRKLEAADKASGKTEGGTDENVGRDEKEADDRPGVGGRRGIRIPRSADRVRDEN
ncbi:MAG TPA: hypothetical protein PL151_03720 [Phycisphaerae bacterium]|nr:hypothetical protein [Phycisphaerae bacterium]HOM52012.1 hypothetical protein [Phycisphaerae bacterium]HPP27364.1 hypothetical protein [Phycisphaerae bacterium]HQE26846.1 hypothetical protein [Phycisphaerae bacterium]